MRTKQKTRAIHCPVCGKGRVIDAADGTDTSRLQLYGPDQAEKAELFSKCPKCRMQIGIAFQASESR